MSEKHGHYFKDVSNINQIDVYRVLSLFNVTDSALAHAAKKILCAGSRGAKDLKQDIQEAIDTLNRKLEMIDEDSRVTESVSEKPQIRLDMWKAGDRFMFKSINDNEVRVFIRLSEGNVYYKYMGDAVCVNKDDFLANVVLL